MSDLFAPVGEHEERYVRKLDGEIERLRRERDLASIVAQLADDGRFQAFLKVISDSAADAEAQLRDDVRVNNDELRVLQGKAQAYRWVANVCLHYRVKARAIDAEIAKKEAQRKQTVLPDGRVTIPRGTLT